MASTTAVASSVSTAIDVNGLVSQLMTAEQIPITKLATKTASYQAKLSAFGTIQGAMASFQSSVATMSNASTFQTVTATASDTTTMSATALTSALPGSYSIEVSSLAQAQTLVANGQASLSTAIGSGASTTLSFDFGTITGTATNGKYGTGTTFSSTGAGVKTVTIDSTNNTLQGMRDAINAANIGVTASIINDGSTSPYRLVVSSAHMGAANSMKISANGDATVSALLANDPTAGTGGQNLTESVAGLSANFKVNGIAISKNSNTVMDVIPGVTLNLSKITTAPVTLTVAQDTASVTKSVTDFVAAYNTLTKSLTDVSSYNAATKTGAVLQGDATVRNLQAQLRGVLNTPGAGTITSLSQIGVTFQRDGTLALDSTKLATVMKSDFTGIAGLFASTGKASDSLTTFMSSTSSTKPGIYPLTVTKIATQGNETGSAAPNLTIGAGTNDALVMNIDGINATITLTPKTYATAQDLASEIQSKINGITALSNAGIGVAATVDATGKISVTSNSYGSTSSVIATSGNGLANIFGSAISTTGVNVTGTINGIAATGTGQTLTGGSGDAQGLAVFINGGTLGNRGTITFTQGYAYALNNFTTAVMATGGVLSSSTTEINNSIKSLADRTTVLQQRLIGTEARYRAQFTALDQMLASMNTTSTFLTQQLSKL
jgi:flagellar hook-associated protein 2